MVSFDVFSLYMNIPKTDALSIVKDYSNNHDQFTREKAIPQDKLSGLINLVLITTWNTFNSQFYEQTGGLAMGGPASSTTTEIYLQSHEQTVILTALHPEKVGERFSTAVYSLLKRTYHIDNLHRNIKFTMVDVSNEELAFVYTLLK